MSNKRSPNESAIAPIRKHWGGARRATTSNHERAGKIFRSMVAPQTRLGGRARAGRGEGRRQGSTAAGRRGKGGGRGGSVRSRQPAADRIDQRQFRHSRVFAAWRSARSLACGPPPCLVGRSGDSRFYWPGGEREGLQRSQRHSRLWP